MGASIGLTPESSGRYGARRDLKAAMRATVAWHSPTGGGRISIGRPLSPSREMHIDSSSGRTSQTKSSERVASFSALAAAPSGAGSSFSLVTRAEGLSLELGLGVARFPRAETAASEHRSSGEANRNRMAVRDSWPRLVTKGT